MCEGVSKQTPDLRILPRRDHAPGFETPLSATAWEQIFFVVPVLKSAIRTWKNLSGLKKLSITVNKPVMCSLRNYKTSTERNCC